VIWVQGIVSFGLWMLAGWLIKRRQDRIARWARSISVGQMVALGAFGLIGSAVGLFFGLAALAQTKQLTPQSGFTVVGWVLMTLLGAGFVALQTLMTMAMFSRVMPEVTSFPRESSKMKPDSDSETKSP
jgi:hypothetical protein